MSFRDQRREPALVFDAGRGKDLLHARNSHGVPASAWAPQAPRRLRSLATTCRHSQGHACSMRPASLNLQSVGAIVFKMPGAVRSFLEPLQTSCFPSSSDPAFGALRRTAWQRSTARCCSCTSGASPVCWRGLIFAGILFSTRAMMKKLWLLFAQAITLILAPCCPVLASFRPEWLATARFASQGHGSPSDPARRRNSSHCAPACVATLSLNDLIQRGRAACDACRRQCQHHQGADPSLARWSVRSAAIDRLLQTLLWRSAAPRRQEARLQPGFRA